MHALPEPLPRNEKQTTESQALKRAQLGADGSLYPAVLALFYFLFLKELTF